MRSSLDTPCYRAEEKRPPDEVEYDIRPEGLAAKRNQ
jgi:hypothetical protein